ncbi:MAG: hypothetical protein KJZ78_19855 [Bryobacteraceae bacterium]|nr:hypothetical protein [Bryobacteraceae bacterium]
MSFDKNANAHLPERFATAHDLAFAIHDILLHQLHAGWRANAWVERTDLQPGTDFESEIKGKHPIEWFFDTQSPEKIASLLNKSVYPFLLGDFLHYVYEALECSRKGKTTVAFSLLRKPLKESLFIMEILSTDPMEFARKFREDIASLYSDDQKIPEKEKWHLSRIRSAVIAIDALEILDPVYIAKLRYSRNEGDSFASAFDMATHLVTNYKSIKTDPLNFNFIFSDLDSIETHWAFIYSRLPYLLYYAWRICEHAFSRYGRSDPVYLHDIDRRIKAMILLWFPTIDENYRSPEIVHFVDQIKASLEMLCMASGWRKPTVSDLERMALCGAWPGESKFKVIARDIRYKIGVKVSEILGRQ